eukprot:928757-Rhodomonas_salina.4
MEGCCCGRFSVSVNLQSMREGRLGWALGSCLTRVKKCALGWWKTAFALSEMPGCCVHKWYVSRELTGPAVRLHMPEQGNRCCEITRREIAAVS